MKPETGLEELEATFSTLCCHIVSVSCGVDGPAHLLFRNVYFGTRLLQDMETPFPTATSHLLPVLLTSYHSNNPVDYKGRSQAGHSGFCPDSVRFVL